MVEDGEVVPVPMKMANGTEYECMVKKHGGNTETGSDGDGAHAVSIEETLDKLGAFCHG